MTGLVDYLIVSVDSAETGMHQEMIALNESQEFIGATELDNTDFDYSSLTEDDDNFQFDDEDDDFLYDEDYDDDDSLLYEDEDEDDEDDEDSLYQDSDFEDDEDDELNQGVSQTAGKMVGWTAGKVASIPVKAGKGIVKGFKSGAGLNKKVNQSYQDYIPEYDFDDDEFLFESEQQLQKQQVKQQQQLKQQQQKEKQQAKTAKQQQQLQQKHQQQQKQLKQQQVKQQQQLKQAQQQKAQQQKAQQQKAQQQQQQKTVQLNESVRAKYFEGLI